jgi:DHA2 family multidrug resistance protein
MRTANPIANFRVLGERNMVIVCLIMFCAFAVMYASSVALPQTLQVLLGYTPFAPAGAVA